MDLRSRDTLINREKVAGNFVFEVVEPVTVADQTSRVIAELGRAILDQGWEGIAWVAVV